MECTLGVNPVFQMLRDVPFYSQSPKREKHNFINGPLYFRPPLFFSLLDSHLFWGKEVIYLVI